MSVQLLVSVKGVTCQYQQGTPIKLPDVEIVAGQHTLLLGASGCGKTTLINIIAGLQTINTGTVALDGAPFSSLPAQQRDRVRGQKIGLVMQRLHLISALTVRANLALAQTLAGLTANQTMIEKIATALGITDKLDRPPRQLSQGEAQRAAIARAVINQPMLLLADEPTSALDDANCAVAIELLLAQAAQHGATLLVATHDARIRSHFAHVVTMAAA
ncbi:MAG: ATP-binding cassette domain-containing protein [Pseudomonadota bacterium]